jgi:hypothetical protein
MRFDGCPQQLIVASQRRLHPGILLPQARRPLEIREEKRDRPGRKPCHDGSFAPEPDSGDGRLLRDAEAAAVGVAVFRFRGLGLVCFQRNTAHCRG